MAAPDVGVRPAGTALAAVLALVLLTGCTTSGSGASASPRTVASVAPIISAQPSLSEADAWAADMDHLDDLVRVKHVSPFTIHTEAEWKAKLAEIGPKLAGANPDEQFVLVASLVGLLDTHSGILPKDGLHPYEVLFYKFSDGWFTIAAKDKSLIGSRLISIGGRPVNEVESTLRPLIPHDNEMSFLDGVAEAFSLVEFLHGSAIVADPTKPQYVLEHPDGMQTTVDFPAVDEGTWADDSTSLASPSATLPRPWLAVASGSGRDSTRSIRSSSSRSTTTAT